MEIHGDFTTSVSRALSEIEPNWRRYTGLIICGTHEPKDVKGLLKFIKWARTNNIPYLGICHGYQLAAIEYAKNVLKIKDATSEEFGEGTYVVKKRKKKKVGLHDGESYWSDYEVVIDWKPAELFFVTPSHPEYQSMIGKPHPLLVEFLEYAKAS